MTKPVIAGAVLLLLTAISIAVAQQGNGPTGPPHDRPDARIHQPSEQPTANRVELHAQVARLRAEIEVLQLEHDLSRQRLAAALTERFEGLDGSGAVQTARDYMRIGAEVVGKGSEFEAAMREKGDEIWQAVTRSLAATAPAELDRIKQDFLKTATELNRKKIDLVALEVHLEGSM